VFENRVLRRIFGPKRDEVTGDRRKLRNEELRDLYYSSSIIRMNNSRGMLREGHVARVGRLLIGKPERKRLLRRPRRRWLANIKIGLGEMRWDGVMWTGLVWLRIGTGGELL
jgi:hypothetical protein